MDCLHTENALPDYLLHRAAAVKQQMAILFSDAGTDFDAYFELSQHRTGS